MQNKNNFDVLVSCMTYNQSSYIEDALNGFVMQQTSFPFVCLVMDDASTDGEQEVIKAFLERECDMEESDYEEIDEASIIIARHRENRNCTFAVYFLKHNLYGTGKKESLIEPWQNCCKYVAWCEGDDYWISTNKLQIQVDLLGKNPDIAMCCTDAVIETPDGIESWTRYNASTQVPPEDMIKGGGLFFQTASLLYRKELMDNYPSFCSKCHVGDYPLEIWGALNGLYFIREKMVTYRYKSIGSWTARRRNMDIDKLIEGWRSEVDMLQNMDEYSEYKYHDAFVERETEYVYSILLSREEEWMKISPLFKDVISKLPFKRRFMDFCMTHNLRIIYNLWRMKVKKS